LRILLRIGAARSIQRRLLEAVYAWREYDE
jgi:hypothetical protein